MNAHRSAVPEPPPSGTEQRVRVAGAMHDQILDAILVLDREGRVVSANPATIVLLGYSAPELRHRSFMTFLSNSSSQSARADLDTALAGAAKRVHLRAVHRSGRELRLAGLFLPIEFDGGIVAVHAILHDTTSWIWADQERDRVVLELEQRVVTHTELLEAANREIATFSYSAAHDLRAPVRAISGFGQILLEEHGAELSAITRRYVTRILDNSTRMGRMVDALLAFSHLNHHVLTPRAVDMHQLAEDVLAELSDPAGERHLETRVEAMPFCRGDPALLRLVYRELLENALKFTSGRDPAVVEVGWQPDLSRAGGAYYVRDNGVGFDMRHVDKLFHVFERLSTDPEYEGTGIGLANVRRIVLRHGGAVWAEGAVGRGATVWFALPILPGS